MFKKFFERCMKDENKVLLRKLKDFATLMTTSLKEPLTIIPKGRPWGSKKKLSEKQGKQEQSTKWNLSVFEYMKTIEEQKALSKAPDKLSQVS